MGDGGPTCLWTIFGEGLHNNTEIMGKYAPDLMQDRFYQVLSKYHWVPLVALGLALLAIGGLPWLLWGVFLRVVFGLHCTWLVNSAHPYLGVPPIPDHRRLPQLLVGGAPVVRRGLAQQPSRPTPRRPATG